MTNPIRPTDNDARALAMELITAARFGALGVIDPATQAPLVSRVAVAWIQNAPHLLVSDLSQHTKALAANPTCSLLLGEPQDKGDPLTHPRVTLQCTAQTAEKAGLRDLWLTAHPKAKLYLDFADFNFIRLDISAAFLNGGFGKAFHLKPEDLKA